MCNEKTYPKAMADYIEYKRLEAAAKAEKERLKDEIIQYMRESGLKSLEHDGIKATYTTYTEVRLDGGEFEKKAPKTFQRFLNLYHKKIEKTRFVCK